MNKDALPRDTPKILSHLDDHWAKSIGLISSFCSFIIMTLGKRYNKVNNNTSFDINDNNLYLLIKLFIIENLNFDIFYDMHTLYQYQ